jgi:FixJ family two-component response regulator
MLSLLNALPATRDMPIMVITGRKDVDERRVQKLGAAAFLTKPFSRQLFSDQVSRLLF